MPRKLGRGSGLKINDIFWKTFLYNAAFFKADNSNYLVGAGSALSIDVNESRLRAPNRFSTPPVSPPHQTRHGSAYQQGKGAWLGHGRDRYHGVVVGDVEMPAVPPGG